MGEQDWQPISSAPKDGSYFIAYDAKFGTLLVTMHWDGEYQFMTDGELWSGKFSHWMPLPAPPSPAGTR